MQLIQKKGPQKIDVGVDETQESQPTAWKLTPLNHLLEPTKIVVEIYLKILDKTWLDLR